MITRRALPLALFSGALASGDRMSSSSQDPSGLVFDPDRIRWQPDDPPGARYALLDGDRDRPGSLLTYAFWLPGGIWAPHHHSQAAVVRGTLKLGFGPRLDRTKTIDIPAGYFFIVRAGEAHYEGSEGECLIIGTALGGWKTTVLDCR